MLDVRPFFVVVVGGRGAGSLAHAQRLRPGWGAHGINENSMDWMANVLGQYQCVFFLFVGVLVSMRILFCLEY